MDPPETSHGTPRWVKISGAVALVLVLLVVAMLLLGGPGEHGPGRHSGGGDALAAAGETPEGHKPPARVPEH